MTWEVGRQGQGYRKKRIFSFINVDMYLIAFDKGFKLPMHTDAVSGKKHYRLNILLKGEDAYIGNYIFKFWRIILFRSDQIHGTVELTRDRLLLSIGAVI